MSIVLSQAFYRIFTLKLTTNTKIGSKKAFFRIPPHRAIRPPTIQSLVSSLPGSMKRILLLSSLVLVACILGGSLGFRVVTGPGFSNLRNYWKIVGNPSPDHRINFTIGLTIRNKDLLESLFWQVSDPKSANYKQYLEISDLVEKFGHTASNIEPLIQWLQNSLPSALISVSSTMNSVHVAEASVKSIQNLFGVYLQEVESVHGDRLVRCVENRGSCALHMPSEFESIVQLIEGISDFPPRQRAKTASFATNINVTPKEIFAQYNVPKSSSANCNLTAQTVAEFSGSQWLQSYSPVDLRTFQTTYDLLVQPVTKLYGVNKPTEPTGEASLDIQYLMAVAQGVPTWFWGETGSFLNYLVHIENEANGPLVHSISYSIGDENQLDPNHMILLNNHFQLIGLRGISLIWASGDDGTGNTGFFGCGVFSPGFPASSPYITSVGATSFTQASLHTSENNLPYGHHAASYSGGGFSNSFKRPEYQQTFVKNYFSENKNTLPPASYYNATGRGYPDVAVVGTNFMIFVGGFSGPPMPVSGTSAATPVFSAMLALINNELKAQGKKSVGFINPAIYQAPTNIWNPITQGSNPYSPCNVGFTAAAPWAPISGLGSPNFQSLLAYFLKL